MWSNERNLLRQTNNFPYRPKKHLSRVSLKSQTCSAMQNVVSQIIQILS
jgi:hypothetical protein